MKENAETIGTLSSYNLQDLIRIDQPKSMKFLGSDNNEVFRIHWGSGSIDVYIADGVELNETAERFFDYLKTFIFLGYDIVKKENV